LIRFAKAGYVKSTNDITNIVNKYPHPRLSKLQNVFKVLSQTAIKCVTIAMTSPAYAANA